MVSESFSKHWTPRRCYTAAAIVLVLGLVLFILFAALVVSTASEKLALRTAKCTVVESRVLPEEKFVECQCGVTCESFYPCLKIFVDYVPEDGLIGVQRRQLLHYSLSEEAQNTECSFEPKENGRCEPTLSENTKSVLKYQASKGVVNSSYDCYYDPDKTSLVFSQQPDRTHLRAVMANSIFWPLFMVFCGVVWILCIYWRYKLWCCAGAAGGRSALINEDDHGSGSQDEDFTARRGESAGRRPEY